MPFVPKDWQDFPSTATPISASALEDVETRLATYTDGRTTEGTQLATFEPAPQTGVFAGNRAGHYVGSAAPAFDPLATSGLIFYMDPERLDVAAGGRDLFQRADSTTLGTSDSGAAWTEAAGDLSISSNALINTANGVVSRGLFDGQLADGEFEWMITLAATTADVYCLIRGQTSADNIALKVAAASTPSASLQLLRRNGASDTQITNGFMNASTGLTAGATVRIRVRAIGNVYRVYVDDVEKLPNGLPFGTDSSNSFLDQTGMGAGFTASDTGSKVLAVSASPIRPVDGATAAGASDLATPGVAKQATIANRPVFVENALNGSRAMLRFDGTDRFTTTASADGKPMTLMAVVNLTALGAIRTLIGSSASGGITFRVAADGTLELLVTNVGTVGTSTLKIAAGRTYLLACRHYSNNRVDFWIDGIPAGATKNTQTSIGGSTIMVGARADGTEAWIGDMGPVLVWNRVLQGSEFRRNLDGLADANGIQLPQRFRRPSVPIRLTARGRGGNLHPSAAQFTAAGSGSPWTAVWNTAYDSAWNTSSVDAVFNAGGNCFRAIGDIATTNAQQATYLTRYAALIDYAATKGMQVMACLGDLRHMGTTTMTQMRALTTAFASMCAGKSNVMALELFQELGVVLKGSEQSATEGAALGFAQEVARLARVSAPNLPIGFSDIGIIRGGLAPELERQVDYARLRRMADFVDYFDAHLYLGIGGMSAVELSALAAATDMPIILGEVGLSRAISTSGERDTYYRGVGSLIAAEPQVMASFMWAARTDNYGFVNEAGSYVGSDIEPGFRTWPVVW